MQQIYLIRRKKTQGDKITKTRNTSEMKEQDETPEKINEIEASNQSDAEFKALVIRILNELKGTIDYFKETFSKETGNIQKMVKNHKKGPVKNEEYIRWNQQLIR